MPITVPRPAPRRLWSDFEHMLLTGAVFPLLLAFLFSPLITPLRVATVATAMLGLWLSLVALVFTVRGRWAARRWRRVRLQAICADIGTEAVVTDSGLRERYFPRVRYAYTVAGRQYAGSRYHLDAGSDASFDLEQVRASVRRASGATRLYVNPRDPSESCLSVEQSGAELMRYVAVFFIGLLLAALGLGAFIAG